MGIVDGRLEEGTETLRRVWEAEVTAVGNIRGLVE